MTPRANRAQAALALLNHAESHHGRRNWREAARALGAALREEMAANVARVAVPANDSSRVRRVRKDERPTV